MKQFAFVGQIPASKSLLNRALVVQSFFPQLEIVGDSTADDVVSMRKALAQFSRGEEIPCSHAGTVLRFMALRVAREPGRYTLSGSERLFSRPQSELGKVLGQLGAAVEWDKKALKLQSWGWKMVGDALHVPMDRSSQFASAVLLSSWGLDFPLCILLGPNPVSSSYLEMTIQLLRSLGMKIEVDHRELRVPAAQQIAGLRCEVEPDMSSAFALAAAAAVAGQVTITGMPEQSLQPDFRFIEILKDMNVKISHSNGHLHIEQGHKIQGVRVNLTEAPDMFPSLAVLASLAEGESFIEGAPQLEFKESQRKQKTLELIRLTGRDVREFTDGIAITGEPRPRASTNITFDPDQDHRMAMAAALYQLVGEPIEIQNRSVVAKSFPGFWAAIGLEP